MSGDMEESGERTIQARDVYVLMKKDYRISRNIRASWFFQHLNKTLQFTPQEQLVDTTDELQVVSVVPDDGSQCLQGQQYNVALLPSSMVTFVARRYRFVIILDVSPSVGSVDTCSCCVLYEKVHSTLSNFLRGLVLPFQIPGSRAVLSPEVHITVIAYTPVRSFTFNQVLAQGLLINADSIEKILTSMAEKLKTFETTLANNFSKCLETTRSNFANSFFDVHQAPTGTLEPQISKDQDIVNNPEAGIVNMIRYGMMALQLLPENSSAGLVVVTDGCLGVPDANLFEFLLTQLRTSTIACTFLRIGEDRTSFGHFGHIPHTELMQFIATATFGSYFDTCPDVTHTRTDLPNVYHKAMFMWSFQRGLEGFRFDLGDQHLMAQQSLSPAQLVQRLLSHPIHGKLSSVMPNIRKRHSESNLGVSLFSVLSVRLREGYTIRDIALTKGETQLEVRLVLPWREYARFEYLLKAAWPLDKHRQITHTEITIEGSYDFIHDMTCTNINTSKMSTFRSANVKKFWQVLQGLRETDQLLVHLQSFASKPEYYTLPGSIKEGVPLFYLPLPNSITPTLSTQLNSKDQVLSQFASFWRPVVNLDIKVWQKWMHTHRIGLVLEHDIPVNKHIHIRSSSFRYSMVMCRQALTSLNLFLTSWSTFVLLDSQSYIRLMYEDPEDKKKQRPPSSFVLIRITSKAPCLVLRLAFLGDTPGFQRYELVKELRQKVAELKFPKRGSKSDKDRRAAHTRKLEEKHPPHKPPLQREWSEIKCCVLLVKPVESILIRYEKMPHDMTKLEEQAPPEVSQFLPLSSQPKNKSAANQFNSLSRYLLHQRWVWTLQQAGVNSITMSGIGRILSTLTKMRIQQGFHFGLTNQGIVNMMLELDMKDTESGTDYAVKSKLKPTCVVQYILFPPYTKTTSEGLSDDDEEIESTEDDRILQIIMECWVEPQHGVAINNTPERKQFEGLTCDQIPAVFFPQDLECVSSLLTFEHLSYLCQNNLIPADLSSIVNTSSSPGPSVTQMSPTIQHIDFPFDLLSLLPKSQQAELIYPTYMYDANTEGGEAGKEANNLLYSLLIEELSSTFHRQVGLSLEQSTRFMHHVHSRSRSTEIYPYPFEIGNFISLADDKSERQFSQSNSQSSFSQTKSNQSQSSIHKSNQSQASIQTQASIAQSKKDSASILEKDCDKVPEWKCFIKGGNSSSLTLTFIPASFNDVILLNESNISSQTSAPDNEIAQQESAEKSEGDKTATVADKPIEKSENADEVCNNSTEDTQTENRDTKNIINNGVEILAQPEEIIAQEPKETGSKQPLLVPVYIYDCLVANVLESLINPWEVQMPADIYQDMTFDPACEPSEEDGLTSPKLLKRVSFSVDSFKDEDEPSWRSSWRSQERRSTEGSTDGGENLWQQCSSLSEMFYNCFVKGVFQSLQKGFSLDSQDVDSAINNICEEALPLESNMTTFLHASCGHFQLLVNEARKDEERLQDQNAGVIEDIKTHSVRFLDIHDDTDGETQEVTKIPNVLEIPKVTLTFDLSLLHLELPCDPLKDIHQLIKNKFLDTVQKWFRQVPSSQDYYFYCPESAVSEDEVSDERETTASDTQGGSGNAGTMPESDASFTADTLSIGTRDDRISIISVLDSEESMEDDAILDLDITQDDRSDHTPLFINFTCTVKSRLQQYSLSLRNIAVCIGELSTILEKFTEVELSDLKITFDLNCLTLPSDLEITSPKKPSMIRMLSHSSATLGSSSGSELEERGSELIDMKHLKDPISHLPPRQHDAVIKCMEEIEWLLQDEIVSNLRHLSPICTDALSYVAKHIQSSQSLGKANVSVDNVPLQFVFGTEQSHEKFIEEFQKIQLQNYQLTKEDEWYYLSKKRILAFNYVNASMLSSALVELSQWNGKQTFSTKACSPSSVSELTDSKSTKNLSPLVGGAKNKSFEIVSDNVACSSPLTVKSDGHSPSELKRHSRESSLSLEKRTSSEGINLENVSLINRRRSKDLVLKMIKSTYDGFQDKERRRSSGEHATVDKVKTELSTIDNKSMDKQGETIENENAVSQSTGETTIKSDDVFKEETGQGENETVWSPRTPSAFTPVTSRTDSPSAGSATFSASGNGSHVTSAVQSPVISDVSIQLTKTDGHSEPFRVSPEMESIARSRLVNDSFDSEDLENEAILKRSSSFAGFRSTVPCVPTNQDTAAEIQDQSPLKGQHYSLIGPQGRSRHCSAPLSGQDTPRSKISTLPHTPSCISSRGSFVGDGESYDGDMSEIDDSATTFSESGFVSRLMPNFWIIMHINVSNVDLLFQHRETGKETNEETLEMRNLLSLVKCNVETTCRRVNQQLLLNDLYESRMCHNLLVDAAEEEVSWKLDKGIKNRPRQNFSSSENDDDEDDDDMFERKYLAAAMDLNPGHFDCPLVWKTEFYMHPGLKRGSGRGTTISIGFKALRSVLNPLSVNNRNNMFVIMETTTKHVFYLRLKEIQSCSSRSNLPTEDSTDTLSASGGLRPPETQDADSMSISSSNSTLSLSQSQKVVPQDCVELSVHGIDDVGKEIKEDLVQMLQKKLDEATLDKISEMLRRNPQCQLDSHDVEFIQKPNVEPAMVLHLTVSNRASTQLAAVMYYLRQNLLQFLHPPKYKSSLAEHQFMDTFDGKLTPIPIEQAFLYVPPHTARKTGIAVISVCLVDGQGHQVKLLQCPRPSCLAYLDIQTKQDLESFVVTQTFDIPPNSKKPGPTALIQFHIWQVGDVDFPVLQDKLMLALKHALCDVVMEYHILTAPLCTVPKQFMEILPPPPTHSAPTSPFFSMQGDEFRERKFSMINLKKPSDTHRAADRRASLQSTSRFQALKDAFIQSSKKVMSPTLESNKVFELPAVDSGLGSRVGSPMPERSSYRPEHGNIVSQYESGDRGTLNKMYSDLLEDWFLFCSQLETPSVNKLSFSLKSRFSVDYILQEFQHMVSRISQTMTTKVYKMLPKEEEDEDTNIGVLYMPNRSPFEMGRRRSETSLDNCRPMTLTPGVDRSFTAVSRDIEQWYTFIHQLYDEEESDHSSVKGKHPSQKFPAHIPSASEGKTVGMFWETSSLIPRQRFLLLSLKNKQIWLYAYNWTNDAFSTLSKHMTKLVQWNNCRTHLLSNVVTQKCGLFNHYLYGDVSYNMEKLTQQTESIDQLINHPAPLPPNKEKLTRTHSVQSVRETYLPFDVTFKDLYPNKPLHVSYLAYHSDSVKQYGQQAQDIRLDYKKQIDRINNISKLYVMWVQKMAPNFPISEVIMKQLKQASRLFHYCATPLLFSSRWRQHVLEKFKVTRQDSQSSAVSTSTPDNKARSRHGSGASTGSERTKRTGSNELKKRPSLSTFKELQSESVEDPSGEEDWHLELRSHLLYQYIKYLQTIGFHYVQMDKSQDKGKVKKRTTMPDEDVQAQEIEIKATEMHNLQKTVSGGILLIEISFRNEYFCVKLFTCDHNKLGITVNQQKSEKEDIHIAQELKLLFVDECEKCKDLIHVHSFAHDFHLRCIQSYISGQNEIFKPGYYLSGLLKDFVKVYAYAPSFSRNFLQREVVSIPKPSCSSQDLWVYMYEHANLYSMSVLKMVLPPGVDTGLDHSKTLEHALISHEVREVNATDLRATSPRKKETYNIGLVILQDCSTAGAGIDQGGPSGGTAELPLKLQFYMILTSSETLFPHQTLDRERGVKLRRSHPSGDKKISVDLKEQITVKKSVSVREQSTNYLGFSNKHQPPMYQLLQKEAIDVRDKIEKMAVASMDKCRRDNLWTKMLVTKSDEQSGKKRSDTDTYRNIGRLTFEEFQEMLDRVHKIPLHEMDPRLVPFVHMSAAWYQGLAHVLNSKYPEIRCFINPENTAEQHHIILNPKLLDFFMMLSIDTLTGKTGLYAVFRKPTKEQESSLPGQTLPEQCVHNYMEQFINTCCFHMWSSML